MDSIKRYLSLSSMVVGIFLIVTSYNACSDGFQLQESENHPSSAQNTELNNTPESSNPNVVTETPSFIPEDHTSNPGKGSAYWVAKNGSDNNDCSSESKACKTIQKAANLLAAGDTLNIKSGTYTDDGGRSAHKGSGASCGWEDNNPASSNVCVNNSGTVDNPITIQAAPGHVGNVIIDGQKSRLGIHLQQKDYIHIKYLNIVNAATIGIASWGTAHQPIPTNSISEGVVIEGNTISNVVYSGKSNVSGVGAWASRNWIIRNNRIDCIACTTPDKGGHTIQAYGAINALVEHNHLSRAQSGVYWKDHFVADKDFNPLPGSEIRYNLFESLQTAVNIAGANEQSGSQYIHHNIIRNINKHLSAGIYANIAYGNSPRLPVGLIIEYNLFDGMNSAAKAIHNDAFQDMQVKGNIFLNLEAEYFMITHSSEHPTITYSDYNVFVGGVQRIAMDIYGLAGDTKNYNSLSDWQSAQASISTTLTINNPDKNSISAQANELFNNTDNKDYTYRSNSPAKSLMPDGTSAGPYQYGNEIIGIISNK